MNFFKYKLFNGEGYITIQNKYDDGNKHYGEIKDIFTEDEKELKYVAEGAIIPSTNIHTNENLVQLHKRGRSLFNFFYQF